ncbi:alpha/beta fold hydrolase [Candidatus Saccharibacteria bacterium]|nr:alpha/beta fold hydrolase [Candidatus Saccharibacteria bacterium]
MKNKLCEVVLPTDRWSAKVVSPIDISNGVDTDKYGDVVIVHPGWAKAPERHAKLLFRLASEGFLPIGIDTRYAYSDRRLPRRSLVGQQLMVGNENPFFAASAEDNRWRYRRPTVLLDICERLGVEQRSYVGHSEGGRISTLATVANSDDVSKLVLVNSAGTGSSAGGGKRLAHSNVNRIAELAQSPSQIPEATISALGSTAYALTHLRRTLAEKRIIQLADTWTEIDKLEGASVVVTILHAESDELISFGDSRDSAASRQWLSFIPTPGGHSNVYETHVHDQIIRSLRQG